MKNRKFLLCITTILIIFSCISNILYIPTYAIAEEKDNNIIQLNEDILPECISYETAMEAGHIERIYEDESELYTAAFLNSDGTSTLYVFPENIKYIDSMGNTIDKSNKLAILDNGSYTNPIKSV